MVHVNDQLESATSGNRWRRSRCGLHFFLADESAVPTLKTSASVSLRCSDNFWKIVLSYFSGFNSSFSVTFRWPDYCQFFLFFKIFQRTLKFALNFNKICSLRQVFQVAVFRIQLPEFTNISLILSRLIGPVSSFGSLFSAVDVAYANWVMEVDPVWCTIRYSSTSSVDGTQNGSVSSSHPFIHRPNPQLFFSQIIAECIEKWNLNLLFEICINYEIVIINLNKISWIFFRYFQKIWSEMGVKERVGAQDETSGHASAFKYADRWKCCIRSSGPSVKLKSLLDLQEPPASDNCST